MKRLKKLVTTTGVSFFALSMLVSSCASNNLNNNAIRNAPSNDQSITTIPKQVENTNTDLNTVTEKQVENTNPDLNTNQPRIQIAILLDSSGSMNGLIDQARTQIWSVVNAISKVTKNGEPPLLEVSLYHYGNDKLPSAEGFNRMLNQLTTDLDIVSENLFSIQTDGGQEYAGWVIDSAINQLQWSEKSEDFRVIFIAGNEPFNQGNINWQNAINKAIEKDVLVNTIYCGTSENKESNLWANAASEGKGSYFNLNQNQKIVSIDTPYDDEIAQLNQQLNETYIPYGNQGAASYERQQQQDNNAFSIFKRRGNRNAGISRAITKASRNYRNSNWDLVDAFIENRVDLNKVDRSTLPENLRSLTDTELREYVEEMKQKREQIKATIAELSQKRTEYINKNTANSEQTLTLDSLMTQTLYKQLETKGFTFQK